jgi:amino acid adenylation domain-containing protein
MMNRSETMLIAILGIIRAGGGYVPVDPEHPGSRTAYILGQSGVKVVLTEEAYRERLTGGGYAVVVLPPSNDQLPACEHRMTSGINQCSDLLYVMYTSGSTGKPKGVEIEHRSVVNFLLSMQQKLAITAADRLMAVTTYSFDISVLELLLPLVSGATVILPARRDIQDGGRLVQTILEGHPNILQCTPGMWQMLLEAGWRGDGRLKALCGGERMGRELAGRLLPEVGELWNMYGPTETTIWSSMHRIAVSEDAASIGTPIANTEMYILNAGHQLLPVGIAGELYIGGRGLARGYRDMPDLTRQRFVENPFKKTERIYRTGDMAMWRPDGTIAFFGRSDDQVKIRGYRVEPAEIEYSLTRHPQVSSAVVTAERGDDGGNYLVAYVVLTAPVTSAELRDFVRGLLPEYMIPGYFIVMDQLPLSANGKIDRQSLPKAADARLLDAGITYEGAGSRLESELVRIWQEVLIRERIGIRDNFFELGGHSLRAVQILSRIHQETGVEIGLHELFNHPRIADIARIITNRSGSGAYEKIAPAEDQPYYELSHAQRRLWVLSRFPEGSLAYNIAGAYRMKGKLNHSHFRHAFDRVIERHESLRTVFITVQGTPMQHINPAARSGFSIQERDIRLTGGWTLAKELAHREVETPFDLMNGPLIRASLLQTDEEEYVFLLTLHHIITDGWSMEIIVREVMTLYEAYEAGLPDPLQPLRIQYKDYAQWQNAQINSPAIVKHRDYWLNLFKGELPVLQLPADYPRPDVLSSQGKKISHLISKEDLDRIKAFAHRQGSSLYTFLMSVTKVLLYRYTGQEDIIVGYPLSIRHYAELEAQVGVYLNVMPLRTRVEGRDSFREVLSKVRAGVLKGHQHHPYPFDSLVRDLNLPIDTARAPLFDVVVVLQNLAIHQQERYRIGDIVAEIHDTGVATSSIDLRLEFIESRDHLTVNFEFNTGLFKARTIQKLLSRWLHLMRHVLDDPETPIENIEFEGESKTGMTDNLKDHFTMTF